MSKLNVVVPMAGLGSRFKNSGFDIPKPLLKIGAKYFFQVAIETIIHKIEDYSLTFIVLDSHKREFQIDEKIIECFPGSNIVSLPSPTSGAAQTAYIATRSMEENTGGLLIADCDQWIDGKGLIEMLNALTTNTYQVVIPTFHSTNPGYGYIEPGRNHQVQRIVEKETISELAVAGCYGFQEIALFNKLYLENIDWGNERYMSNVVKAAIIKGVNVQYFLLDSHVPFGTPEEWKIAVSHPKIIEFLKRNSE